MKAKNLLLLTLLTFLFLSVNVYSQKRIETPIPKPITGDEKYIVSANSTSVINSSYKMNIPPVKTSTGFAYFFQTGVFTVYDLQSNGVAQQIWQDPLTPSNVHATFMHSPTAGFVVRYSAYLFSNDGGFSWSYLGDIPDTDRSGFPAISGFDNGAAVIGNHNNAGSTEVRTKLYSDAGPGFGEFSEVDPGNSPGGLAIWPKLIGVDSNKIVFVNSVNAPEGVYTNTYNGSSFSGYTGYEGDVAEGYYLAKAPDGTIGHAYIGGITSGENDVFYRFSTNDGVSWSSPQLVWDWNLTTDSIGCLNGVSMTFGNNNQPYVAFNASLISSAGFFPELPSSIRVWSPNINGGVPVIIADSSNVPFFPNKGVVADGFLPVCRPAIGRTSAGDGLIVAFTATSGQYGSDSSAYYSVWSVYSRNGGISWVSPDKLTPATPLRDWRFVSISPTNFAVGGECNVQMTCLADSLAGTHALGAPFGRGELIGIRYSFPFSFVPPVPSAPSLISPQNNSINVLYNPLMDWSDVSGANSYRLQISENFNFSNNIIDHEIFYVSQYRVPDTILSQNTLYYWRVNGKNISGSGPWSVVYNFRTFSYLPLAPVLNSPLNNSTGISLSPMLDWEDVNAAMFYHLQVAADSGFSDLVINQNWFSVTHFTIPVSVLNNGIRYYWRVSASNINGIGDWSEIWNFRTLTTGIENLNEEIPVRYKLHNNYPNPFNPSTKIEFELPEAADVEITVYDFLGRKVKDLVSQILQAGRYRTEFNARGYASGIYFYTYTAGKYRETRRMILIK